MGDVVKPRISKPTEIANERTFSIARLRSFSSVTIPLLLSADRSSSNCGLISTTPSPPYFNTRYISPKTYSSDMKLKSLQRKSTAGKSGGNSRAFARRKSTLPLFMRLSGKAHSATSTAITCSAPWRSKQSVNPPFEQPISAQILPCTSIGKSSKAFSSLNAPCEA